jgi:hypothetical protein
MKILITLTPHGAALDGVTASDFRGQVTAAHVLGAVEPELERLTAAVKAAYAKAHRRRLDHQPARPTTALRALPANTKEVPIG